MRRTLLIIGIFELIALGLALLGMWMGLHTDEAKYLLSIPYPHPPAIRWLLSLGLSLPFHEFLMRFILASVTVQAGWLLWDLGTVLPMERQAALVGAWLLSSALITQGGTVMLVTGAAVFGLIFVWSALHPQGTNPCRESCIGLLWLLSLFSAYQCLLFAPLVWQALRSNRSPLRASMLYFFIPILLLAVYSLGHPLTIASMVQVSVQDASLLPSARLLQWIKIIMMAGGFVTSILGLWGILTGGRKDLLLSSTLILLYIFLSSQPYYAILLLPPMTGGLFLLFCRRKVVPKAFLLLQVTATIIVLIVWPPVHSRNIARETITSLKKNGINGMMLIDGPYGHEWQYESTQPVRTFSQELRVNVEDAATVFLCTKDDCSDDVDETKWKQLEGLPVQAWGRIGADEDSDEK